MSHSGIFKPKFPEKYKGDPTNIIYRSLWEQKLMIYLDHHKDVLKWSSEEIIIPYRSPWDNRMHRYFPDFYVKVKTKTGTKKWVVEVKPKVQCKPPRQPKRKTKKYLNEVRTFAVNQAKWMVAKEWCKDRNMEFIILTEVELMI